MLRAPCRRHRPALPEPVLCGIGPYCQQARPTSSFWRRFGVDEQDMVGDRPNKSTEPSEECRLNEFFSSVNYFTVFDLRLDYSARRGRMVCPCARCRISCEIASGGFDPRTHWAMN